jgi:hypothetical protein
MSTLPVPQFSRQDLVDMARRAVYDGCGAEEGLPHDHWYEACTTNKFWLAEMRQAAAEAQGQLHQATINGPISITRQ